MRSPVNETVTISGVFGWKEESAVGSRRPIIKPNAELIKEEHIWLINVIWELSRHVRGCIGEIVLSEGVRQAWSRPHIMSNKDKKEEGRLFGFRTKQRRDNRLNVVGVEFAN